MSDELKTLFEENNQFFLKLTGIKPNITPIAKAPAEDLNEDMNEEKPGDGLLNVIQKLKALPEENSFSSRLEKAIA